jgi:hypothetical protein
MARLPFANSPRPAVIRAEDSMRPFALISYIFIGQRRRQLRMIVNPGLDKTCCSRELLLRIVQLQLRGVHI